MEDTGFHIKHEHSSIDKVREEHQSSFWVLGQKCTRWFLEQHLCRLLHCKVPVKQAVFMVYWTKKRRVHLWRSGFYSTLPQVISQRTSYFSKAISNIVHYVSLMFPCTFTLLPLQAVSQSLPHLTNSWSLHGLLLAVDCQGEWEKAGLLLRDTLFPF